MSASLLAYKHTHTHITKQHIIRRELNVLNTLTGHKMVQCHYRGWHWPLNKLTRTHTRTPSSNKLLILGDFNIHICCSTQHLVKGF